MASNRPRRHKEEAAQPQKTSKGKLNNMELLGIGLFCIAFLMYGLSKCGKEPVVDVEPIVTEEVVDSGATANVAVEESDDNASSFSGSDAPDNTNNSNATVPSNNVVTNGAKRKLYVITDSLRVRQAPNLAGELVTYLMYGEEVIDLGERTELEKLRVSPDEVRTAPWIKIKNKEGQVGWTFGAYLQFYPVATTTNVPTEG